MNKTVIISIIVGLAIVALVLFFVTKKDQDSPGVSAPVNPQGLPAGSFPIKKGDKNRLVMDLQTALNSQFASGLVVDGDWGPKTDAAVKKAYKLVTGQEAPASLTVGEDLLTKFYNYTPVSPTDMTWRNNTWINAVITDIDRLTRGGKMEEIAAAAAQINSMARYSDTQLRMIYNNYKDKYFRSMTVDLGKYTPGTGTADGYKILMAKLSQLNLK